MSKATSTEAAEAAAHETRVRALRDACYGRASSDANWNGCREAWMEPEAVKWLEAHAQPLPTHARHER